MNWWLGIVHTMIQVHVTHIKPRATSTSGEKTLSLKLSFNANAFRKEVW